MKKKVLSIFVAMLFMVTVFNVGVLADEEKNTIEKIYELEAFHSISIHDAFRVEIVQGDVQRVTLTFEKENEENMDIVVSEGVLNLGIKEEENIIEGYSAKIVIPEVVRIESRGASKISGEINTNHLELLLEGASKINIDGSADFLSIESKNASEAHLKDLIAKNAVVVGENASKIDVTVEDTIVGSIKNATKVNIYGEPVVQVTVDNFASEVNVINEDNEEEEEDKKDKDKEVEKDKNKDKDEDDECIGENKWGNKFDWKHFNKKNWEKRFQNNKYGAKNNKDKSSISKRIEEIEKLKLEVIKSYEEEINELRKAHMELKKTFIDRMKEITKMADEIFER